MKRVAILNWAGHLNFGDQLFIDGLQSLFKKLEITVFTDAPNKLYPQVDFKQINKHELFVLGGGELINEDRLFIPPTWSNKIKIPKIILGCGVNAKSSAQLSSNVIKELRNFSYIGLRDQSAVDILSNIPEISSKVDLFYDLAYSINIPRIPSEPLPNTAIVIPTDRFSNQADLGILEHNIAETSKSWLKNNLSPFDNAMFLPFGVEDNNDWETCNALSSCAANSTIIPHNMLNTYYVCSLITNASHVFPYRLHGLILSHILGTPYTFYPYHQKLARVHATITTKSPAMIKQTQKDKLEVLLKIV